ncbi:MAG: preprotein translocase subunit YajC [Bacteroidales bacterium]|nr:preprotein translocase subunit YajC [Bacteroidales bacterium]
MNQFLFFVLMGAPAAPAGAQAGQQPSMLPTLLMFAAIIAVMWLFMIRPQRKQQKELQNFRDGLKKGDKVVTVGGIYGEILEVNEKSVLLRVDGDVKLRVDKQALNKDYSGEQR